MVVLAIVNGSFEVFFVFIIVGKFVKFIKNMLNIYKLHDDLSVFT